MDDDEDILPLELQTERPPDLALHQQRVQAWHPILDPVWVIIALFYLGVVTVPAGYKMKALSDELEELKWTYDKYDDPANQPCGINTTYNAGRLCSYEFEATKDMRPPILVYYELTNFHQNHRDYYDSKDPFQLLGQKGVDQDTFYADACSPLNTLGDIQLNPCGLIANTFFNDVIKLVEGRSSDGDPLVMLEKGIAWSSDLEYKFAQVEDFDSEVCPSEFNCSASCCDGDSWSCKTPYLNPEDGECHRFYYPDDDTTQYLYETYPNVISPLEGVTNEHFVVWMRVAALPTFRKLYGFIDQPIAAGTKFTLTVESNYVVESFGGSKSIIIATNNIFGGKNPYLSTAFIAFGYFCILSGAFFTAKHMFDPRKIGDKRYLHYKED